MASLDLTPLSWASGPADGQVLAGSDDGRATSIYVIDTGSAKSTTVTTTKDIAWRGVFLQDTVVLTLLSRADRSNMGLFELDLATGNMTPLAPAPEAPSFGTTWSTELYPSLDGSVLAVQDCAPGACRTSYYDTTSFALVSSDEGTYCHLIGVAGDSFVAFGEAACNGEQPADVVIGTIGKAGPLLTIASADVAVLLDDVSTAEIAASVETGGSHTLSFFSMDGAKVVADVSTGGLELIDTTPGALVGIDGPPGWVVVGPSGRLVEAAGSKPELVQAGTGATQAIGTLR